MRICRVLLTVVTASIAVLSGPTPVRASAVVPAYEGLISREQVMRRAADWLRRDIPYSQDNDDAAWDVNRGRQYRPDCSGFVSMAWALDPGRPGRGRALVTWELPTVATRIRWAQITTGDILLHLVPADRDQEHVVLFQTWVDRAKTRAWIVEQSGHRNGMQRKIVQVAVVGHTYQPYRYRRIR